MKRLILLSTASALRGLARLPVSAARKLADAADWLEEKAQVWQPVEDFEISFSIIPCNRQPNEDDHWERAKYNLVIDLYTRLLNELVFLEPVRNLAFYSGTNTLQIPPFQLTPAVKAEIASGSKGLDDFNLEPDFYLLHGFFSEAIKIVGGRKMNLSGITLSMHGQCLYLADALEFPRLHPEWTDNLVPAVMIGKFKLSPEARIWTEKWLDSQHQLKEDLDYQIRKGSAVQELSRQILALREKCNFRVIRERVNLLMLWQRGGHYYRDVPQSLISREFSEEAAL